MTKEPCQYPILHRYSESSARAKLECHRKRGDDTLRIIGCPGTDHWHTYSINEHDVSGSQEDE